MWSNSSHVHGEEEVEEDHYLYLEVVVIKEHYWDEYKNQSSNHKHWVVIFCPGVAIDADTLVHGSKSVYDLLLIESFVVAEKHNQADKREKQY